MSARPGTVRARQQQLARWARRTPGYQAAVQHVLPAVRRNATLTDLVWRVFMPQHGVGTLPVPFTGGRHVGGRDAALLPVVGVLALGLDHDEVERLVEQVADLQRCERSFRPLLVLDRPDFATARRHGYVVELVVPQQHWADHPQAGSRTEGAATSWSAYLGRRLADIVDHYQLWHLARVGPEGLDPLDLAVLRAIAPRLPATLEVSVPAEQPPGPPG